MARRNTYYGSTAAFLLDQFPGAFAAWSVARRLGSAYAGPLERVKRSSDSGEMDIGFDAGGDLDTSSMLAFTGGGDGFLPRIYDQVGTLHLTQTGSSNQPQIVTSGAMTLIDTRPFTSFNGTTQRIGVFPGDIANPFTLFFVIRTNNVSNLSSIGPGWRNTFAGALDFNGVDSIRFRQSSPTITHQVINNTKYLEVYKSNMGLPQNYIFRSNGALIDNASMSIGSLVPNLIRIAANNLNSGLSQMYFAELIIYPNDQSANFAGIENNINAYYNIF